MDYLFDPDNWEWLTSGGNFRFILEGFLINLEIAFVSIILALIVGLALALLRLSTVKPVSFLYPQSRMLSPTVRAFADLCAKKLRAAKFD